MEIDLPGQTALVVAGNGSFVGPLEAALAASGASVSVREPAAGEPQTVVAEMMTIAGRLDVLVFVSPTLSDKDEDDPAAIFETSAGKLDSYTHAASHALAEAGGRIVVIGSALGLLPSLRNPLGGLADAALFQLVRETAMWLGPRGVRINALALGAIGGGGAGDTPSTAGDDGFLSHTAFKRPGTIADVTNAMLFLADPQNTYMTGHILTVDGGWTTGFARDF